MTITPYPRTVTIGALNLPSQSRGGKANLTTRGTARVHRAVRIFNEANAEIVVLTEAESIVDRVIGMRPNWDIYRADFNNQFPHRKIGNAIAYRVDKWELFWSSQIHLDYPRNPGGLHLPVAGLMCRTSGQVLIVIGVHYPTKKSAPFWRRRAMFKQTAELARQVSDSQGDAIVVMGDFNDKSATLSFRGFATAIRHNVDIILIRNVKKILARAKVDGVKGVVSDHPFVLTTIRLGVNKNGEK